MTKQYERLTLGQVAAYPRPGLDMPRSWGFTPDGTAVTYLASERGDLVLSLWQRGIASGRREHLAGPPPGATSEGDISRDEALRRERLRLRELGVTSYHWAEEGDPAVLLVPTPGGISVRTGEGDFTVIPGTAGVLDPRLCPDGSRVAFVRGGDLFVAGLRDGAIKRLTQDAEDGLTNGLAEFIAQEELDRAEGYWWSPDSRFIAFERADSRHIGRFRIVHDQASRQDIETHEYPFAGDANARVSLGVVDVAGEGTRWLDLGDDDDIYVARVAWRKDGSLIVSRLSRDQQRLELLEYGPGETEAHLLLAEEAHPWINLDNDLRFLDDGTFVRSSERTGYRHLALHAADGSLVRDLTGGDWVVTGVLAVDQPGRLAYFQATREDVRQRHIYAVSLDGGPVRRLTREPGWHGAVFDRKCERFVSVYSSAGTAPVARLCRAADGEVEAVLFHNAGMSASALGLEPPGFVQVAAADGTPLHGAVYAPPTREPGKRYPVIVSVYGGPHAQRVADDWTMTVDLRAQYLAQNGFVVLKLDNRGSANRGLAFEAHLAHAMGTVEIEDQVTGVRSLEALGFADTLRVGIYGWSYGGYMTCLALMRAPDVFKVGVAGAPVTDWDGYDTGYTERYMGTPASNPDGYREGSVLTHVASLRGKLLLVHGLVDENVHFRHTVRLLAALTEAQKEYDLLLFPGERHMPRGAAGLEYMERRLVEYFTRNL